MPACGPVRLMAGTPSPWSAIDSNVALWCSPACDPPCDALDPVGVGDRGPTELLDDERGWHGRGILPCGFRGSAPTMVALTIARPEAPRCASTSTVTRPSRRSP